LFGYLRFSLIIFSTYAFLIGKLLLLLHSLVKQNHHFIRFTEMDGGTPDFCVAIVGEGVVGISTALAIREAFPAAKVGQMDGICHVFLFRCCSPPFKLTLFSDRPFAETSSFGPAGIFRVDSDAPHYQFWAAQTFYYWASLAKDFESTDTGGLKEFLEFLIPTKLNYALGLLQFKWLAAISSQIIGNYWKGR
jgi:hypothetical protein